MIGEFIITKFIDEKMVEAKSGYNENIVVSLYLMPLNRKDTSEIAVNDKVFAVVDDVTGFGAVLMNLTHDFAHRFDYDVKINGKLNATGDIKSGGEVTATGSLSHIEYTLTGHTHGAGEMVAGPYSVTGITSAAEVV